MSTLYFFTHLVRPRDAPNVAARSAEMEGDGRVEGLADAASESAKPPFPQGDISYRIRAGVVKERRAPQRLLLGNRRIVPPNNAYGAIKKLMDELGPAPIN